MRLSEINIRDPFIMFENEIYYLYGTRAKNFGKHVGGFDVYTSKDMIEWSTPAPCFDAKKYELDNEVCWAPDVHKFNGKYYMFATFTSDSGIRGTYSLVSNSPNENFVPTSGKPLTPCEWECLDGTLYVSKDGKPFLVFCHEHTQIIDGAVCYVKLNNELSKAISEPITLFYGSTPKYINKKPDGEHYITDGPFMYRSKSDELFMIWSTFIDGNYAQCIAQSNHKEINGEFIHLEPLIKNDGGHGMIFKDNENLYLTFHSPNKTGLEHPVIVKIIDNENSIDLL